MDLSVIPQITKQWFYGSFPGVAGSFPYYGTKVYFPKGSKIFVMACEQGIYEAENVNLILGLVKPDSIYFDIGANIGLMALPVLDHCPTCKVISWEPSPNALPFLQRTVENSRFKDRWNVIGKAAGDTEGEIEFYIAGAELGALDGFQNTQRAGKMDKISVPVTTVDQEWEALGRPPVSVIKIDVEGGELQTLTGANQCIQSNKPHILIEWTDKNLSAYNYDIGRVLTFAHSIGYGVFSVPDGIHITNRTTLKLQMLKTESFLLAPES